MKITFQAFDELLAAIKDTTISGKLENRSVHLISVKNFVV